MKRIGTTVRLANGGGFDLRGCPDPEVLAFTVVRAVNAHERLVLALKTARRAFQKAGDPVALAIIEQALSSVGAL